MTQPPSISTLGELRATGYRTRSDKEEMRANLVALLRSGEPLLPGILGYDQTVLPQIENAILAGQDVIMLGERGQAKSRIARSLIGLLDEWVPEVAGAELHDDPLAPVSPYARALVDERGDDTPIAWLSRDQRYGEKLATPDITIADLVGEVDPVKVAEGRYLSDALTIHYGLLPRTNRGIFALNELPDLAERIQVGLLNLMEERDVQIRGYKVRLELDMFVIASANPEDYTSRGRIITPLKDRFGAQIRTHYPEDPEVEIAIVEAERTTFSDDAATSVPVQVPGFMREIVAELSQLARRSSEVSQRSGVSVRVSISNQETLLAAALKRAVAWASRSLPRGSATCRRWWPRPPARSSSRRSATRRARTRSSRSSCSGPSSTSSTATSRCPSWRRWWSASRRARRRRSGRPWPPIGTSASCQRWRSCAGPWPSWTSASRRPAWPAGWSSSWRACTSTGG